MKKFGFAVVMVAVLVAALFSAGSVDAKGHSPNVPQTPNDGNGMMRGGMVGSVTPAGDEILHDDLMAIYSVEIGISVDDLNARLDAGETLAQIALAEGMTIDVFRTLLSEAHDLAVAEAVKDGTMTQEQADWMSQRGTRMSNGTSTGGRGARSMNAGTLADCPYLQTNP